MVCPNLIRIAFASRSTSLRAAPVALGENDMSHKVIRSLALIAASAAIAVGAVVAATRQTSDSIGVDADSLMSTGVTVTESTAPTTLSVTRATPGIKGPAPLPSEEQGVPG
jgi:hypothetical protein